MHTNNTATVGMVIPLFTGMCVSIMLQPRRALHPTTTIQKKYEESDSKLAF